MLRVVGGDQARWLQLWENSRAVGVKRPSVVVFSSDRADCWRLVEDGAGWLFEWLVVSGTVV